MPDAQPTKTGIIYISVRTDAVRTKVGSTERLIEKGFITFAGVGTTIEIRQTHQTWAQLRIMRREAGKIVFPCVLTAGYVDSQHDPHFRGHFPIFPGDALILEAISTAVVDISATIRFERD